MTWRTSYWSASIARFGWGGRGRREACGRDRSNVLPISSVFALLVLYYVTARSISAVCDVASLPRVGFGAKNHVLVGWESGEGGGAGFRIVVFLLQFLASDELIVHGRHRVGFEKFRWRGDTASQ